MFEVFGFYKFAKIKSLKKNKTLLQDFLIKKEISLSQLILRMPFPGKGEQPWHVDWIPRKSNQDPIRSVLTSWLLDDFTKDNVLKIYIPKGGVFISTPKINSKEAAIKIDLSIKNELVKSEKVKVSYVIFDDNNKKIDHFSENIILQKGTNSFENHIELLKPQLWSPNNPYLYSLQLTIKKGTNIIDKYTNTFGIRSISFSAKNGFELNGVKTILKGVCLHHDAGPVGTAVPDDVLLRRLKILKKMGAKILLKNQRNYRGEKISDILIESSNNLKAINCPSELNSSAIDEFLIIRNTFQD